MAPGGNKENSSRNARSPGRTAAAGKPAAPPHPHRHLVARSPPARPPESPVRARGGAAAAGQVQAAEVARYLSSLAAKAEHAELVDVVRAAGESLLRALAAAVTLRRPRLLAISAALLAQLSAEKSAAEALANKRYLAVLEAALARDVGTDTGGHTEDAWKGAARAVRNLTAFNEANTLVVARETQLVRLVVRRLESSFGGGKKHAVMAYVMECTAALANIIRYGTTYQSYVHKHGGMKVLAAISKTSTESHSLFHSCRALAEFSLNPKWLMALISEGCIPTSLKIIESTDDSEIAAEATRCVGNLSASKVGREAVLKMHGLERVIRRVTLLGTSVQGTLVRDYSFTKKDYHLAVDLFRAMSNMCVSNKAAAKRLIDAGGVMALISACDQEQTGSKAVHKEAFRGLLILAQAGPGFRATVLREIGIRIRHDTILGRSTAHLYDLGRRVKIEASTEQKDDIPQTIAGLGSASRSYFLRSASLAERNRQNNVANSVPGLQSPAQLGFRRSGRVLSVQRHVPHHQRLEKERRQRAAKAKSPVSSPAGRRRTSRGRSADYSSPVSAGAPSSSRRTQTSGVTSPSSGSRTSSRGRTTSRVTDDNQSVDVIPQCTLVEGEGSSGGNLIMAALAALTNVMSGVSSSTAASSSSPSASSASKTASAPRESTVSTDTFDTFDDPREDVYEIGEPLGRGGFATVFLAKNLRTQELVAVKRFHPPMSTAPDARKKAEQAARRAVKEQRIWDGLSHKNIVSYRGCFFGENSELNLVAEYIPGWSLADHLSQITLFPEHMVARIARQIVDGLDYLHKMGVTHRDVKPANILVHPSGLIKITDFGVSSAVDVPTMTGNSLVGTPWYIAPEMIEGRPYGKSVDVWSLGCTILELAVGRRPYHDLRAHAAMYRMTQDRYPPIPSHLSPKLKDFLKTCWVWNPEERPSPSHLKRHPFLANISDPVLSDLANMERVV